MSRTKRACLLLLYPPYVGLTTALMAPAFGNPPARMLLVGTLIGWIAAMTFLAIVETKQ